MTTTEKKPGEVLCNIRQEQGISLSTAGLRAIPPLTSGYMSLIETGKIVAPRIDRVERLAQAYDITSLDVLSIFGINVDTEAIKASEAYAIGQSILDLEEPYRSDLTTYPKYLRSKGIA